MDFFSAPAALCRLLPPVSAFIMWDGMKDVGSKATSMVPDVPVPGMANHDKLLLLSMEVPHMELLQAAVLPSVRVVECMYDPDGDGKRGDADMMLMGNEMMGAVGPVYKNVGIIDYGKTEGFSMLLGHMVPLDMLWAELMLAVVRAKKV